MKSETPMSVASDQKRWEYCFILSTCNLGPDKEHGGRVRTMTNPFTRATTEISLESNMAAAERIAVRRIFDEFGFGPDMFGEPYALSFPSGDKISFRCGSFDIPDARVVGFEGALVVRQLSEEVLHIVLRLAREGNFALESPSGEAPRLVNKSADPAVQKKWNNAGVINTIADLRKWLEKDLGGRRVTV